MIVVRADMEIKMKMERVRVLIAPVARQKMVVLWVCSIGLFLKMNVIKRFLGSRGIESSSSSTSSISIFINIIFLTLYVMQE